MDLERINKIFTKSKKNPDCIGTQEGYRVEYKKSFGWGNISDYVKAMASMANNKGGHIIFGIKDKPHTLIGLDQKAIKKFEERDLSIWSKEIRECFEPSIEFDKQLFLFEGKAFGVIEVYEATNKPIICKKYIENKLRQGAIYYRYKAENTDIHYAELKNILDIEKKKINDQWIQKIQQISTAGISNVMILDSKNSKIHGNNTYYISEELIEKINFIEKGRFVENGGEPTLRIVGEVSPVKNAPIPVKIGEKEIALHNNRIVESMLFEEQIASPNEYIKHVLNTSMKNLPIFYYLNLLQKNEYLQDSIDTINEIPGSKFNKDSIIKRVSCKNYYYFEELKNTGSSAYEKKKKILEDILEEKSIDFDRDVLRYFFNCIRCLQKEIIISKKEYIIEILKSIYRDVLAKYDGNIKSEFRKTICYLDEIFYKMY